MLPFETVALCEDTQSLRILDQTRLPGEVVYLTLTDVEEMYHAIKRLSVRGAPAIGVAAAIGLCVASYRINTADYAAFYAEFMHKKARLASSRPTAVNLFWALNKMEDALKGVSDVAKAKAILRDTALSIYNDDIAACQAIGQHGASLIRAGDGLLTHCNAGALAAVRYGTALAPMYVAKERGVNFRVFADETRPLLQGARLTAFELSAMGVDVTVICDNMVSQVMKNGWVQAVFVGADRIAANGDACNKIGTSGVAILAKYYGIPFYVCAPMSTIDFAMESGAAIPIEQRDQAEVTEMWYEKRMVPMGVKAYNPAFDVTEHALISGIITEKGIARAPFGQSLTSMS